MQKWLGVIIILSLLCFIVFWGMLWAKLPVEGAVCVSLGTALTAAGLNCFGASLLRTWDRGWWKPPPGTPATR